MLLPDPPDEPPYSIFIPGCSMLLTRLQHGVSHQLEIVWLDQCNDATTWLVLEDNILDAVVVE